jgi:hypothetical protein
MFYIHGKFGRNRMKIQKLKHIGAFFDRRVAAFFYVFHVELPHAQAAQSYPVLLIYYVISLYKLIVY